MTIKDHSFNPSGGEGAYPTLSEFYPKTRLIRLALSSLSTKRPIALPSHLDRLIDLPWSSDASSQIDRWLDYCESEGIATVRGVRS